MNYIFDAYGELKQSQQGKSFYAFWEFLLSADLQKEWDELAGALYKTLENRGIDAHDMFLKEMKKHLFDAGEKVAKTNDRMSEKLSRIIRQNGHMNAEATKQVINDIKKLLIEASRRKEKPDASLEYETIDINLPLERPLTLTPVKETVYKDKPDIAGLSLADLESIGKLYNPVSHRPKGAERPHQRGVERQTADDPGRGDRAERRRGERSVGSVWIHWRAEGI